MHWLRPICSMIVSFSSLTAKRFWSCMFWQIADLNIVATGNIHEYELYLDQENIDHTKTNAKSPRTNGICERFHKTILSEFYQIAFRKKIYDSIEMLQNDLDEWLREYNESRPHRGKYCYGKTPMQTSGIPCLLQKRKCCSIATIFHTKRKYDKSSDDVVTSTGQQP